MTVHYPSDLVLNPQAKRQELEDARMRLEEHELGMVRTPHCANNRTWRMKPARINF